MNSNYCMRSGSTLFELSYPPLPSSDEYDRSDWMKTWPRLVDFPTVSIAKACSLDSERAIDAAAAVTATTDNGVRIQQLQRQWLVQVIASAPAQLIDVVHWIYGGVINRSLPLRFLSVGSDMALSGLSLLHQAQAYGIAATLTIVDCQLAPLQRVVNVANRLGLNASTIHIIHGDMNAPSFVSELKMKEYGQFNYIMCCGFSRGDTEDTGITSLMSVLHSVLAYDGGISVSMPGATAYAAIIEASRIFFDMLSSSFSDVPLTLEEQLQLVRHLLKRGTESFNVSGRSSLAALYGDSHDAVVAAHITTAQGRIRGIAKLVSLIESPEAGGFRVVGLLNAPLYDVAGLTALPNATRERVEVMPLWKRRDTVEQLRGCIIEHQLFLVTDQNLVKVPTLSTKLKLVPRVSTDVLTTISKAIAQTRNHRAIMNMLGCTVRILIRHTQLSVLILKLLIDDRDSNGVMVGNVYVSVTSLHDMLPEATLWNTEEAMEDIYEFLTSMGFLVAYIPDIAEAEMERERHAFNVEARTQDMIARLKLQLHEKEQQQQQQQQRQQQQQQSEEDAVRISSEEQMDAPMKQVTRKSEL